MRLTSLSLEQFRCYDRLSLDLADADRMLFVGENGAGKTNIVEAVSFLSVGRSCLQSLPDDVLRWGKDFFRLRAETQSDAGKFLASRVPGYPRKAGAASWDTARLRASSSSWLPVMPTRASRFNSRNTLARIAPPFAMIASSSGVFKEIMH